MDPEVYQLEDKIPQIFPELFEECGESEYDFVNIDTKIKKSTRNWRKLDKVTRNDNTIEFIIKTDKEPFLLNTCLLITIPDIEVSKDYPGYQVAWCKNIAHNIARSIILDNGASKIISKLDTQLLDCIHNTELLNSVEKVNSHSQYYESNNWLIGNRPELQEPNTKLPKAKIGIIIPFLYSKYEGACPLHLMKNDLKHTVQYCSDYSHLIRVIDDHNNILNRKKISSLINEGLIGKPKEIKFNMFARVGIMNPEDLEKSINPELGNSSNDFYYIDHEVISDPNSITGKTIYVHNDIRRSFPVHRITWMAHNLTAENHNYTSNYCCESFSNDGLGPSPCSGKVNLLYDDNKHRVAGIPSIIFSRIDPMITSPVITFESGFNTMTFVEQIGRRTASGLIFGKDLKTSIQIGMKWPEEYKCEFKMYLVFTVLKKLSFDKK